MGLVPLPASLVPLMLDAIFGNSVNRSRWFILASLDLGPCHFPACSLPDPEAVKFWKIWRSQQFEVNGVVSNEYRYADLRSKKS